MTTLFRMLPNVGEQMEREEFAALTDACSRRLVVDELRATLDDLRAAVKAGQHDEASLAAAVNALAQTVGERLKQRLRPSLREMINATGVILQTNLGRAPLSEAAIAQMSAVARGYCNLEYDLEHGKRGHRDMHAEQLILDVLALRAESGRAAVAGKLAAVVNNNAAACFLALNSLAEGGEVIVSRGELVEIGGGFRVPDILRKSGAVLREVGTTNRTKLADYEAAIGPETRLILRVHRSNFRMEGFTERPSLEGLRNLGQRHSIPVFEDQGAGALEDLEALGIAGEEDSDWLRSATSGVALVAASGDKLLGGPQCGILVGDKNIIETLRKNPLFRALRVDKLTYAALQATLLAYLSGQEATIPAIARMRLPAEAVQARCAALAEALKDCGAEIEVIATESVIGGGTTPGATLPSYALAVMHHKLSESALVARLRRLDPPVMARAQEARLLLDLRTVAPEDDARLAALLRVALTSTDGEEKR